MATRKTDDAAVEETPAEFPAGEWPEAPFTPAQPQFPEQLGPRLRVHTNVAIFGYPAMQDVEVFDIPEVHAAAKTGLVEILGPVDDSPGDEPAPDPEDA